MRGRDYYSTEYGSLKRKVGYPAGCGYQYVPPTPQFVSARSNFETADACVREREREINGYEEA
jgi:hypothetical protein